MNPQSTHIMAEFHGCTGDLNHKVHLEQAMRKAALAAGATVVKSCMHQFGSCGVSGILVLAESHLSIHTWPEHAFASADIYTCGAQCHPEKAHELLQEALQAEHCEIMVLRRGVLQSPSKSLRMHVVEHTLLPRRLQEHS